MGQLVSESSIGPDHVKIHIYSGLSESFLCLLHLPKPTPYPHVNLVSLEATKSSRSLGTGVTDSCEPELLTTELPSKQVS